MKMNNRIKAIYVGAGLIFIVIGLIVFVYNKTIASPFNDARFDRGMWMSVDDLPYSDDKMTVRVSMAYDLMNNYLYIGMSKSEVVDLLGEPYYIDGYASYYLGYGGWGIDVHNLELKFDLNDMLMSYKIVSS